MAELIECINAMLDGINSVIAPKQLLVIINDLDKATPERIEQILVQRLEAVFSLRIKMIFVLPVSLTVFSDFTRVRSRADASFTLGVTDPLDGDLYPTVQGTPPLKQLVSRKTEECPFEKGTLVIT